MPLGHVCGMCISGKLSTVQLINLTKLCPRILISCTKVNAIYWWLFLAMIALKPKHTGFRHHGQWTRFLQLPVRNELSGDHTVWSSCPVHPIWMCLIREFNLMFPKSIICYYLETGCIICFVCGLGHQVLWWWEKGVSETSARLFFLLHLHRLSEARPTW